MFETLFATSILVSLIAVPLVLWLGGRKVYDVFPVHGKWSILLSCVLALNVVAAIVHLGFGARVSGVNVLFCGGMLFLAFIWIRTLALLSHQTAP
ncbi:hypothetical protein [Gimesia maris]|uniref:hypothetical protein n=1 Tax=Gimesia maris TaxID=122 RepID=UPI003A90DFC6